MKLKDMNSKQLRKRADKLGVAYKKSTSDKELRKAIRAKKVEIKEAVSTWPEAWAAEMRPTYYHAIVGQPMPEDEAEAFANLQEAIAAKAPEVEPIRMQTGFSCFGLWYADKLKQCNLVCQVMPLCQHVCATRPQLRDQVAELESAAQQLQAQAEAEQVATQPAGAPKAKKPKKAKVQTQTCYRWSGDLEAYDMEEADEEAQAQLALYQWMANRPKKKLGQFSREDLIKELAKHYEEESCAEVADAMLQHLLDEGDISVAQEQLKAVAG